MSLSRILASLVLSSCALHLVACAIPTDHRAENSDSQDQDIKKKIKPKGGNGAFELVAPTFDTAGFKASFTFGGATINVGERSEKVPGTYFLEAQGLNAAGFQTAQQALPFPITAGAVAKHQPGGLRIRFDAPVTLGSTRVEFFSDRNGGRGILFPDGAWVAAANGASMLALAGKLSITSYADGVQFDVVVVENTLTDVVLPTSKVALLVDAYDPNYPTAPNCTQTFVRAGAQGFAATVGARKLDGSPNASFVVPQGVNAPVTINAYGIEVAQNTTPGGTNTFQLNRLEIDDVEVALAGGGTTTVKGTVSVARKNADGSFANLSCTFPTHSGMDLPDGTYRVTSRAASPAGVVTSTEDVTFP